MPAIPSLSDLSPLNLLERPPDPVAVELVASRLRASAEAVSGVGSQLRMLIHSTGAAPAPTWRGVGADAALHEISRLCGATDAWLLHASVVGRAVDRLAEDLCHELMRRAHVHEVALDLLGRLATLPADLHRDLDDGVVSLRKWLT